MNYFKFELKSSFFLFFFILFFLFLYLKVRMFGSYEQLTSAIKTYLLAKDPDELFVKILERLESDFESGAEAR